ncbi:MAG: glycosyltransferase [Bacteroidaceae bacterium]|nr:glycosyltransferase [Prevotellaceae bacterium]MDY5632003.1 glycosyltransferase [Bacteroidaceae bacterium]
MEQPKISIITVCLNSAKTIKDTIESVLAQTYTNYEYIIADGLSVDNTIDIIDSYIPQFEGKLTYYQRKDTGMYNAINDAIRKCQGDVIGILNSDDFYDKHTLEYVANEWVKHDDKKIVIVGDMVRVSRANEIIHRYHFTQSMIDRKCCFGHPAMFAGSEVYRSIGLYDESFRWAADGEWQYRAHDSADIKWVLCPVVFNNMREGGASDNIKYIKQWFKERVRMKRMHNKGTLFHIYLQESISVMRTILKNSIPKVLVKYIYRVRYR